jgi:hypothetical protein
MHSPEQEAQLRRALYVVLSTKKRISIPAMRNELYERFQIDLTRARVRSAVRRAGYVVQRDVRGFWWAMRKEPQRRNRVKETYEVFLKGPRTDRKNA